MTGKEFLKSLRTACNELKVLNEELYSIKLKALNTGSQTISERVLSSSTNASMKTVDFVIDLENEIKAKTEIFVAKRTQDYEINDIDGF